ncbi:MAG: DNA primase [Elusimicrobiota bacterium]|jgi:DNA primase|nr:DNA primase [Elusimicrobiota bacterium]
MAIPEEIIDKIKESNDLVSVAMQYLPDLKRSGRDWKACCPFHHEKTPSFSISPERGIFKCFGCGKAGDVFKFIELMDNVPWIEAVRKLAQRAQIEIPENKSDIIKKSEKAALYETLESAANFYNKCLLESSKAQTARNYLSKRSINKNSITKFKLGYAPYGMLVKAAFKKGIESQSLIKAGLIKENDSNNFFEYMSDRLVFPIFDVQGRIVAFGGRTLSDRQPKYINTPETILFSKSSNLYGLFQTLPQTRREREIIVLEGYVDVIIPYQFGIYGAVAPLGTAFTQLHAKLISRYADKVTLLFDSDDAGRAAAKRALEILIENSIETTVSFLPENVDADEYLNAYGKESFIAMIKNTSKNAIDFIIDECSKNINSAESKAKAASEILNFISKSPNPIVRDEWTKLTAQKLNITESAIRYEFAGRKNFRRSAAEITDDENTQKKEKLFYLPQENLIKIALSDPKFLKDDISDVLTDPFCAKIFEMARLGKDHAKIMNALSDDEKESFDKLTSDMPNYPDADEIFNKTVKDLRTRLLSKEALKLKEEVSQMLSGQKERDQTKLEKYKHLTQKLKGSKEII